MSARAGMPGADPLVGAAMDPTVTPGAPNPVRDVLPGSLRLFLLLQAAFALLCVGAEVVCAAILRKGFPYNWPLTPVKERTIDLNGFAEKFVYFHHREFFNIMPRYPFAYPAPMAVLYKIIYVLPSHRTPVFLLLLLLSLFTAAVLVARAAVRHGLATRPALLFCGLTAALSYPFVFEAKQGNLEFFLWLIVAGGIWLLLRGYGYSSAACFALAGSMKIYPLIYLGLHLSQRRWKPFLFGLLLVAPITYVSLWLMVPDVRFGWQHLQANLAVAQQEIVLKVVPREIGFDHSLFSLVKRVWVTMNHSTPLAGVLHVYMPIVALAGVLLYFARIQFLPFANQVLSLAVCSVMLPPVSYDYTLLHLYAPLTLLIFATLEARRRRWIIRGETVLYGLLAVSLAPLSELIAHGTRFGGQVRAISLLLLLVAAVTVPFPDWPEAAGADNSGR